MAVLLKGALIEYGSNFLGPLPNVVLFQFNPEQVTRTIEVPPRPSGASSRETNQAGDIPVEKLSLTAKFCAADLLKDNDVLARVSGIGTFLAALEMMVRPKTKIGGLLSAAIDAVGDALSSGGDEEASQPIPREQYPKLLFIWGLTRVLPVFIHSMVITETHYDHLLNPIAAEVQLGITVISPAPCADDAVAEGADLYTSIAKEALAIANLANTANQVVDLVSF